ncbi:MAG: lipopolysaccharide biosynthesis protein [Sphingopyxis sp.]
MQQNVMLNLLSRHRSALGSLAIRGVAVLLGFGATFFIGHRWGAAGNGAYALVTQTAIFLSVLAIGGLDLSVVKHFSAHAAADGAIARRSLVSIIALSLGLASAVAGAAALIGPASLTALPGAQLSFVALFTLCGLTIARALTRVLSAVLRAQKRYILGQVVEVLLIPAIVLVPLLFNLADNVDHLLIVTGVAGACAAVLGVASAWRAASPGVEDAQFSVAAIMRTAWPLWGVAIALNFADWYGLTTIAATLGVRQAGLYRVAVQLASVFAIISTGLLSVYAPQISAAHARGDDAGVARLARTATWLSTLCVVPPAIILLGLSGPVLALIGPEFRTAAPMMMVLVIGQIIYTITGPAGIALAMMGHERVNLAITLTSTASLILIAPVAAGHFGAIGVATWISIMLAGRNFAALFMLHRRTGVNVLTGRHHPRA